MREQESVDLDPDLDAKVNKMIAEGGAPLKIAEHIAEIARSTAPVVTGAYRDGITAQKTPHGARVYASDNKSTWIEFGIPSQGRAATFNLRRAAFDGGAKSSSREMVTYTSKSGRVSQVTRAQAANYGRNKGA